MEYLGTETNVLRRKLEGPTILHLKNVALDGWVSQRRFEVQSSVSRVWAVWMWFPGARNMGPCLLSLAIGELRGWDDVCG